MQASSIRRADMVRTVSRKAACACVARGEAFSSTSGLSMNDSFPTIQSSAFFMGPLTPCAYSGLASISTSAARMASRRPVTAGKLSALRSGLNRGNSPSP